LSGLVPAAGCGFRRARPWGEKVFNGWGTDERIDGAQMGVASGWVDLSLRRIVGFGGRVRGGKKKG